MRTNKAIRIASLLLVLSLVTCCMVGGTFAKYTTGTVSSDKSRVAYWGFDKDVDIDIELFQASYNEGKVASYNGDNIIAPGTGNTSEFAFGYVGYKGDVIEAPEVAYTITIDATASGSYAALDNNPNFKWTLKGPAETTATEYNTVAELLTAIKKLSGDESGTKTYAANTLPDAITSTDDNYEIGWMWDYQTVDEQGNVSAEQDDTDTKMGNAKASEDDDVLEDVQIKITITATQAR